MKIGIFDLTDCEGCETQFLALKEKLIDLFQDFDISSWRLLKTEKANGVFDIAIIEGFVSCQKDIDLIKKIRSNSKLVVALGNCAINGNFFKEFDAEKRAFWARKIYSQKYKLKAKFVKPLKDFIKIDLELPGCPASEESIKDFIKNINKIAGISRNNKPIKTKEIHEDYIAKIEGHGELQINFNQNRAKLKIEEGERLLEGLLVGKDYKLAPYMTSRICGICPTAHNFASTKAIEQAFGVKLSAYDINLRKILQHAQIIQSHILHLFFLVLPDYYNSPSGPDLAKKYPSEFHIALNIKRTCDKILTIIGGRPVHPTNVCVGGFNKYPLLDDLVGLRDEIYNSIDEVGDLIQIFEKLNFYKGRFRTNYVSAIGKNEYDFYAVNKLAGLKEDLKPSKYKKHIKEKILAASTTKYALFDDSPFMVGALARINNNNKNLKPLAQKAYFKNEKMLNSYNVFYNNLAQAIEVLNSYEEVSSLLEKVIKEYSPNRKAKKITPRAGEGLGVVEAPRGTLYHYYKFNKLGKITKADIITPTVQNLANLERDCKRLVRATKKMNDVKRKKLIENLVRAYDPCITCSVH